ncbi:MAG: ASKHA domain-containing protein [Endomicrobiia bacterium]
MSYVKIKVVPENKEFLAEKSKNLLVSLISSGINIYADCGGEGVCGKCKVKIISGEYNSLDSHLISKEEQQNNIVLACKTFPETDIVLEVLKETKMVSEEISLCYYSKFEDLKYLIKEKKSDLNPVIKILEVELNKPDLQNPISDFENLKTCLLEKQIKNVCFKNIKILQNLPLIIRKNEWKINLVLNEIDFSKDEYNIVEILPAKENKDFYGIAVDLGTTTVVVSLINLKNFETVITKSTLNQQMVYGADVITRIMYAEKDNGLEKLNQKVVDTINQVVNSICREKNISFNNIYTAVVAGNTTMIHLLLKIYPGYIRRQPYVPAVSFFPSIDVKDVKININQEGKIYLLPLVGSYVGGDIVGGVVSVGMDFSEDISVLLDLGTNGEIVLGNKEFLISAACSCGPAFEGVGIKSGIRAVYGAIEEISIKEDKIEYKVIGDIKPLGICGSGLIDVTVELFKNGVIDRSGKFANDVKNEFLLKRIRKNDDDEYEFLVLEKELTANNKDIVITESDIQNILRSKGAIFHGLYTLLKYLDLSFKDIKKIYISGGFGCFLNIEKAKILGLLPDLENEKFVISGNTSLTAAKMFLVSKNFRERVYKVAKKMAYIDLSSLSMYINEYSSSLFIPHTDLSLFPTVAKILK